MYNYLLTNTATGEQHLAEASSPSVAIAAAAADMFTAERVDGNVLALLAKTLPTKRVGNKETGPADPPAGEPAPAGNTAK